MTYSGATTFDITAGRFSNSAYDQNDDMLRVKSVQKKFRDSFTGASLNSTYWSSVISSGGDGTITQTGGTLVMTSGVVANATTDVLGKIKFSIPFRISFGLTLSQRIANQSFAVEMLSVDPTTGQLDGRHSAAWVFDGTTATQAKYSVQNGSLSPLVSSAVTVVTTAANGIYEIEPFADETWFHSGVLDATNSRSNSYRRHQQIPDPNAEYVIRFRWLNGATPPASSTTATIQYLTVQDYAELTAEITAGRGQTTAGQGVGVIVCGSTTGTASISVQGDRAHDATVASAGSPFRIAGRGATSAYTSVANGDVADMITTVQGVQIVRLNQIPELEWSYVAAANGITNSSDVVLAAAAGSGLRRYLTSIQIKNANSNYGEVVIKDGSTIIWRGYLPPNMVNADVITFSDPIKTSANAALSVAVAGGAQVYVNAQGYTAP